MTERLYYKDPRLTEFEARVLALHPRNGRLGVVLDQTAFYPTSGGQLFDTGWIEVIGGSREKLCVSEIAESEDSTILHWLDTAAAPAIAAGDAVRGFVDSDRRRDHMQQHSGQHVLSAAFLRVLKMPTVSFHMGDDFCTIDLDAAALSPEQASAAEAEANRIVWSNAPVTIRFTSREEALALGVRKLPEDVEPVRLIDMEAVDLTACGGTHVSATGEIGAILLRKVEKSRQGIRVEFVCGPRALRVAARDR
ncbi:MAG: alanyl-tRNA editing protein [Candidatus Korobacteraceae bacterium]